MFVYIHIVRERGHDDHDDDHDNDGSKDLFSMKVFSVVCILNYLVFWYWYQILLGFFHFSKSTVVANTFSFQR